VHRIFTFAVLKRLLLQQRENEAIFVLNKNNYIAKYNGVGRGAQGVADDLFNGRAKVVVGILREISVWNLTTFT